ncbi:MAG: hypothetical protein JWR42_1183, partial [Marmoricola sp.]|nr:hypothetical protein [Marmoricola sp.]
MTHLAADRTHLRHLSRTAAGDGARGGGARLRLAVA